MFAFDPSTISTFEAYDEKHCATIMKLLNVDRKVKKTFCNGVLQAEKMEYPIHKCIVEVVSEYLQISFNSEVCKNYNKVLKISSMKDTILGNILDFIYTGFVKVTSDNVFDLLEGAEYMQIDGLKSSCKDYLMESISVENCLKLRAYGQHYNLDELCDASDQFIVENFSNVAQNEDFVQLNTDAVSSILSKRKKWVTPNKLESYLVKVFLESLLQLDSTDFVREIHEEAVFTSIVQWVNHNTCQRHELFVKFFSLIDLSALRETFLNDKVLSEPLVFNSLLCMRYLLSQHGSSKVVLDDSGRATISKLYPDKFVVIGGERSEKNCVTYDSKGKHPMQLPDLKDGRCGATAAKVNNHLYVVGGFEDHSHLRSVEVLNLQDRSEWVEISEMLERRIDAAATVSNGRIVITGGVEQGHNGVLSSCEMYDCEVNQWLPMKPMLQARHSHGMVALNGLLYCVGGWDDDVVGSAECYDEKIDEWKKIAPMLTYRRGFVMVALNGYIYAIGGWYAGSLQFDTVERYSPETNTWTKRRGLNVGRDHPGVCVMNGKIYIIGGEILNENRQTWDHFGQEDFDEEIHGETIFSKSVEVYDEDADRWEICFDMDVPAFNSAVVAV